MQVARLQRYFPSMAPAHNDMPHAWGFRSLGCKIKIRQWRTSQSYVCWYGCWGNVVLIVVLVPDGTRLAWHKFAVVLHACSRQVMRCPTCQRCSTHSCRKISQANISLTSGMICLNDVLLAMVILVDPVNQHNRLIYDPLQTYLWPNFLGGTILESRTQGRLLFGV